MVLEYACIQIIGSFIIIIIIKRNIYCGKVRRGRRKINPSSYVYIRFIVWSGRRVPLVYAPTPADAATAGFHGC